MDAADIMGIGGRGGGAPAARKSKEAAPAKPTGVSREARAAFARLQCFRARRAAAHAPPRRAGEQVWQITQGYSTDPSLPPAPLIPSGGFKEKRKGVTARKARARVSHRARTAAHNARAARLRRDRAARDAPRAADYAWCERG